MIIKKNMFHLYLYLNYAHVFNIGYVKHKLYNIQIICLHGILYYTKSRILYLITYIMNFFISI